MKRSAVVVGLALLTACGASRAQLKKGEQYLEDGRPGAAARAYERVLERKPGHPAALVGVARAWIADNEPERAIVPAQVAAEMQEPGSRPALARALVMTGRGADAVPVLQAELEAQKKPVPGVQVLFARALMAAGNLADATGMAETALQSGGGPPAQGLAAWLHARTDDCTRATALAARSLSAAMSDPIIQAEAAAVFRHCGDAERAQAAANAARALQVDGPEPWQSEAARLSRGGDNEGAARQVSRLRAVWPQEGHHARDLGNVWSSLGQFPRAEYELTRALTLAPFVTGSTTDNVRVVNRQSDSLDAKGRHNAIRDINLRLYKIRGELGDLPGAAEAMQRVAVLDSDDVDRWVSAAQAWARAGQSKKGLDAAVEAVNRAPRNAAVQAVAATLYARSGDLGRAIGHGRMSWELDPDKVEVALELAELYRQRGEPRQSRRVLLETRRRVKGDHRLDAALAKLGEDGLP